MSDELGPRRPSAARRLLRVALWSGLILALLLLAAGWLAGTEPVRERVRRMAEARLEESLGRDVGIGSLDYRLGPLTVVARDVVIPSPREGDPPFARLPRLEVELSFRGVVRPVLTVERVAAERPEAWLILYPDGTNNLPDFASGGGGGRLEVRIGRLSIEEGIFHFDEREIPLTLDAAPLQAILEGPAASARVAPDHLAATAVVGDLTVGLPEARPWGGSASARATLGPGRVEVTGGRLRGPDLAARFEAVYNFGDGELGGTGEVEFAASGDAAIARRLGYLEDEVSGPFELSGEVDLAPDGATYHGTVESPAIRFLDRRFDDVEAAFSGGAAGLVVDLRRAGHAGGTLEGSLTLPAEPETSEGPAGEGSPVLVEARARDLRLAALVEDLELADSPLSGLQGRLGAELSYRFDTSRPLEGDGRGVAVVAGVERPGEDRLPISGRIPFEVDDGVVRLDEVSLRAPGQRLTASGSYDLEQGSGGFSYQLASERLGRLVLALPRDADADAPPWLPTGGTGTVAGEVELRPGGGYTVEAGVELAAVDTAFGRIDRVSAPIRLEDGVLATDDLLVEGEGQRLLLAGSVDLETREARADVRFTSDDLGRLAGLLPASATGGEAGSPAWLPRGGDGRLEGDLELDASGDLTGRVQLDLQQVALEGLTLDRVSGSARFVPGRVEDLRIEAASDGGALVASGSVPLPSLVPAVAEGAGGLGEAGAGGEGAQDWTRRPIDLVLVTADWPLATLTGIVPGLPDLAGAADADAELGGTLASPAAEVRLTVAPLAVAGLELDRLAVEAHLDGDLLVVDALRIAAPAGTVTADGRWDRGTGALDGRLATTPLALGEAPLAGLLPALGAGELTGGVALEATVGGRLEEPELRLTTSAEGLALAGRSLGRDGRATLRATWIDGRLEADGSLLGVLAVDGGGALTPERADLQLRLGVADVNDLVHLAAGSPIEGLSGDLAGTVRVEGRFDAPEGPGIDLTLDPVRLAYGDRRIHNLEPVVVRYGPGELVVESVYLGEPREAAIGGQPPGELFVTGRIGLEGDLPLDLRLQADLSATWAQLVLPDLQLAGRVQALGAVRGTVTDPAITGQGELSAGQLILPDFPHALEDLDGIALFYPDRIVLDSAQGRLGGGRLRAAGSLALAGAGEEALDYRFQVQLRDASLRYPEGFVLRGGGDVTLTTTPDGRLISGVVRLDRAFYLRDVDVGITQLLQSVFEPSRLEAGTADPILAATQLNLSIQGPDALRVRNNVADLSGDIDLVVRGSLADPALFGQVELEEGGEVIYSDNEYEVQRGLLTFANPYRIDPVIDFVATTEVRSYDITLNLAGTLDDLEASFSSDPPLADLEVVSLLTLGRPIEAGAGLAGGTAPGSAGGGASQAAEQLLYGQAASLISERVNTLFGFDRFRLSPGSGTAGTSSVAVTVGQRISRDLFVTYSRDPSVPEEDLVQVEWQVYDNVLVILTRRGDSTYGLDVQVERRF